MLLPILLWHLHVDCNKCASAGSDTYLSMSHGRNSNSNPNDFEFRAPEMLLETSTIMVPYAYVHISLFHKPPFGKGLGVSFATSIWRFGTGVICMLAVRGIYPPKCKSFRSHFHG